MEARKTRTQTRGTCCVCGKDHAVKGAVMAKHGYTVDWGMFNNACRGAANVHYGHKDAPAFLATYVEGLTDYINNTLPELVETAQAKYEVAKAIYDKNHFGEVSGNDVHILKGKYYQLKSLLERELPAMVEMYQERIANWVEVDTYEVDLDVEEAEERKARELAAAEKKAAKLAEQEAKSNAQAERDAKASAKAKAKWEALSANNYYRFYYRGELIESWEQELNAGKGDRELYELLYAKRDAHWASTGADGELPHHITSDYMLEVRSKPEGKGKRLFDTAIYLTPTQYLKRDWSGE